MFQSRGRMVQNKSHMFSLMEAALFFLCFHYAELRVL